MTPIIGHAGFKRSSGAPAKGADDSRPAAHADTRTLGGMSGYSIVQGVGLRRISCVVASIVFGRRLA
jgi:hypothetical protein